MGGESSNKLKIINDPVHGFIKIPCELIYELFDHPIFQRLKRIKQLGLTVHVYPGATHTRFQHAFGAVHLMTEAIQNLRMRGIEISDQEAEATYVAILLHDIGHGPFSHALENSLIKGISHEDLSSILMQRLNDEFENRLDLALCIFNDRYEKRFLHQLVSGQLDMDRMDYLKRDSYFTGVTEGQVSSDRIIKMLDVVNGKLAVEAKGIYSIEKFLIARRLMYWQVYYHKAVVASEFLLVKTLQRAGYLSRNGVELYSTPALRYFLENCVNNEFLEAHRDEVMEHFLELDDSDILVSAKQWAKHPDVILSELAKGIVHRRLPKVEISPEPFASEKVDAIKDFIRKEYGLEAKGTEADVNFLFSTDTISNSAYTDRSEKILISFGNGVVKDIAEVSDVLNISYLNDTVLKHVLCYPKAFGRKG